MFIRKAKKEDIKTIHRWLHKIDELYAPMGRKLSKLFIENMVKNELCLIAEFNKKFAGFLVAEVTPKMQYTFLVYLAVLPKFRGLGLGKKLMQDYIANCKSKEIKHFDLLTKVKAKKALKFYEKFGYKAAEEKFKYLHKKLR